jgi:TonB family protein
MRPALALVVVAAGSLVAQDAPSSRDWVNRGVQAFKQARYPEAVAAFQGAVQADPSSVTAHLYLATAYLQMHVPGADNPENTAIAENAHIEFQKVLAMDANNLVALRSDASLYLNQKRWDDAQTIFEKVTVLDPANADAYYSLGYIAWSRWYPVYVRARKDAGMKQEDPGPIRDASIRQELKAEWGQVLQDGLTALDRALAINRNYDDAMAYENLLVRERADLRDTAEEWRADVQLADEWVQKAIATKKMKAEAAGGGGSYLMPLVKVDPIYPPLAVQAHIQGTVTIRLTIGTDGRPKNLQIVSGHPLLGLAALNAVSQWLYAPVTTEVQTSASVPFVLP